MTNQATVEKTEQGLATSQAVETVPTLSILEARVSVFNSSDDVLRTIRRRMLSHTPTFCVAMNPEKIYRAQHDRKLSRILDSAHIRICDGVGVSLAALALHRTRLPRCTGIDLFLSLVRISVQEGWRVFLLGASPEINQSACEALVRRFPGLRIVGRQHGFFEDTAGVVRRINESKADLLFVAMGSPRQEFWIGEQMTNLDPCFCMGVGGSFDVVSGATKRAPRLFRKTGTEWLYRLLTQPSRLRRQMALPIFVLNVAKALISRR